MNGMNPDPTQGIARDRWQRILAVAFQRRNANPNDMEAHDAIAQAEAALAVYDKAQPNVGGLFPQSQKAGAFAGSALETLGQIPSKIMGAGADVLEGITPETSLGHTTAAPMMRQAAGAMDPMTYVQPESKTALGAAQAEEPGMTLAGQITGNLLPIGPSAIKGVAGIARGGVRGIGELLQTIMGRGGLKAGEEAATAGTSATEAAQAGTSGASPAGAVKQLTPIEGTSGRGFSAEGSPTRPMSKAGEALSQMQGNRGTASIEEIVKRNARSQGLDTGPLTNQPPQFEEGLPSARVSTLPNAAPGDIGRWLQQIVQAASQGYR